MSFGLRILVVSAIFLGSLNAVEVAQGKSPVVWSVMMGGTADSIIVKVLPHVRIKDVRCEVKLFDASRHQVGSFTARLVNQRDTTLAPGVEYSQSFSLDQSGVKHVEGLLLFARPALSSPKATTDGSTEMLERGVPPLGSSR